MDIVKALFFISFIHCVLCDASLLVACEMTDLDCLGQSTKVFLERTSKGIEQYDIRPIDPWRKLSLDVLADENMGLLFHFKNLTVTGLKNQKIYDFRIDTKTKSVVLKTKAELNIVGDIVLELNKQSKMFSGIYKAQATSVGAAKYGYDLKNDSKGVLHFEVGQETIQCESINDIKVVLDSELEDTLRTDPDASLYKLAFEANQRIIRTITICKIVELCYIDVVHNIKAAAKVLPASAFFKNIMI